LKSKTLPITALLGVLLVVATAAMAVETKTEPNQADSTMALQVKLALLEKLGVDSLHVEALANDGAVTLTGMVDKRETMELSSTVAKSVAGVHDVDNKIELEASAANHSRPGAMVGEADSEVKDALLETRLRLALIDSLGNDGFTIGTDAANGVVTLSFNHDLQSARRQQAVGVARHLNGVFKVIEVDKAPVAKT
jgi:osmotically-inducible protein OsmY